MSQQLAVTLCRSNAQWEKHAIYGYGRERVLDQVVQWQRCKDSGSRLYVGDFTRVTVDCMYTA